MIELKVIIKAQHSKYLNKRVKKSLNSFLQCCKQNKQ